jgi:hypothetical protein
MKREIIKYIICTILALVLHKLTIAQYIDPRVKIYVDVFMLEMKKRDIRVNNKYKTLTVYVTDDLKGKVIGLADRDSFGNVKILISNKYIKFAYSLYGATKLSPYLIESLVFHELGHGLFDLKHKKHSLMQSHDMPCGYPFNRKDYIDDMVEMIKKNNKKYNYEEL